jgi:hypothetical protein
MQQWDSLGQIDDVDAIARAVDIRLHLGVPAVGLMSEMNACFEQLAHSKFWHSHGRVPSPVDPPRMVVTGLSGTGRNFRYEGNLRSHARFQHPREYLTSGAIPVQCNKGKGPSGTQ